MIIIKIELNFYLGNALSFKNLLIVKKLPKKPSKLPKEITDNNRTIKIFFEIRTSIIINFEIRICNP